MTPRRDSHDGRTGGWAERAKRHLAIPTHPIVAASTRRMKPAEFRRDPAPAAARPRHQVCRLDASAEEVARARKRIGTRGMRKVCDRDQFARGTGGRAGAAAKRLHGNFYGDLAGGQFDNGAVESGLVQGGVAKSCHVVARHRAVGDGRSRADVASAGSVRTTRTAAGS